MIQKSSFRPQAHLHVPIYSEGQLDFLFFRLELWAHPGSLLSHTLQPIYQILLAHFHNSSDGGLRLTACVAIQPQPLVGSLF